MPKREWVGMVESDRMTRTRVVRVTRLVRHLEYQRVIRRVKRFKADDPSNSSRMGDLVRIEETRPISKDKRWRVVEVVTKGAGGEKALEV